MILNKIYHLNYFILYMCVWFLTSCKYKIYYKKSLLAIFYNKIFLGKNFDKNSDDI